MQVSGSLTALATPFLRSGAVDFRAWEGLLERQLGAGTQGLVVAGSTGEAAMLESDEFERLVDVARARVAGRVPVIAGAGLSATAKTLERCRRAREAGAGAVLVSTPPYVRPTQDGMRRHFETIADGLDVPVLLYNVPSRTAVDLFPDTVAQLAPHPNIAGIKEAVSDPARVAALVALREPGFRVLSGDDGSGCAAMLAGADGVISVISNLVPAAFRRLCDLARAGQAREARALDAELAPLYAAASWEPNPIPVKALLAGMGACEDNLRLPLQPLSSRFRSGLAPMVELIDQLEHRFGAGRAA